MTRELKFRAWMNEENKWTDYLEYDNGIWHARIRSNRFDRVWNDTGNITVEQYTGLRDKNGKEIYEGDIVTIEPYTKPFKVVFDKQYASFAGDNSTAGRLFNSLYSSDYEVIGNVHENIELLKEK